MEKVSFLGRRFPYDVGFLLVASIFSLLLGWLLLHAVSLYPSYLARARHDQAAAQRSFELNCLHGEVPHESIDCGKLAKHAGANDYAHAADLTLRRLAREASTPVEWLGCSHWGMCARFLELVFSYTYLLLPVVFAIVVFCISRFIPVLATYQMMRIMQQPVSFDGDKCILQVMRSEKQTQ